MREPIFSIHLNLCVLWYVVSTNYIECCLCFQYLLDLLNKFSFKSISLNFVLTKIKIGKVFWKSLQCSFGIWLCTSEINIRQKLLKICSTFHTQRGIGLDTMVSYNDILERNRFSTQGCENIYTLLFSQ